MRLNTPRISPKSKHVLHWLGFAAVLVIYGLYVYERPPINTTHVADWLFSIALIRDAAIYLEII